MFLRGNAAAIFMFNPFDDVILNRFLEHNREHFRRYRSIVAYANDIHRHVLVRQGFNTVYRDPLRSLSLFGLR